MGIKTAWSATLGMLMPSIYVFCAYVKGFCDTCDAGVVYLCTNNLLELSDIEGIWQIMGKLSIKGSLGW